MRLSSWLPLVLVGAVIVALSCGSAPTPLPVPGGSGSPHVTSNITRDDYAGSEACATCHAEIYAAWQRSPMHNMTRSIAQASIKAPFQGESLAVKADSARMETRGRDKIVRIQIDREPERTFRVTRVLGGRHREDFVGVDTSAGGDEMVLPVSYVFSTQSWRYKGYSVMVRERPGLSVGPVWSRTCIGCHNTLPALTMLLGDLAGPDAPVYQGSISDNTLPAAQAFSVRTTDEDGLKKDLITELSFLKDREMRVSQLSLRDIIKGTISTTRQHFEGKHLIEEGVGCEACHGGAHEHVNNPATLPTFEPKSPNLEVRPVQGKSFSKAGIENRTCARCHTVLFSKYSFAWEGSKIKDAQPGGSSINSGEARDFLLGGCSAELTCSTCHDPHSQERAEALKRFDSPSANATCTSCHPTLASQPALAAHTHHDTSGAGAACLGCHMPKKNMGLEYGLTRYHRIGSPTDEERVYGDRPLECALCHSDASVEKLARTIEQWWGKKIDRERLKKLYGDDLNESVMRATSRLGKPHEQAVAIAVLGASGRKTELGWISRHIAHDYPLVRYFAKHALETLTGGPVPLDPNQPAARLREAVEEWSAAQ